MRIKNYWRTKMSDSKSWNKNRLSIVLQIILISILVGVTWGYKLGCLYFITWSIYLMIRSEYE